MTVHKTKLFLFALLIFLGFCSQIALAWNHSVELGYGYSHDPNNTKYNNSGLLLSGDIYPLYSNEWTFLSIGGALGQWHTTAPHNQNLTTAAVTLGLRVYPLDIANYPSYLLASAGPAILSNRHFGINTQASNLTIQSNLGLGMEFDCIDVNLRFAHYSNAGLGKPNQGFNVLYLLSIGYLF
jgi:hypothetical protein